MRSIIALALILLLTSCIRPSSAEIRCKDLAGLPPGSLLLLGEMHGSVESPEIAGQIVCQRLKLGSTTLGLEVPVSEQTPINIYLNSKGTLEARSSLTAGEFWQKSKDGRSSKAMLDLIEQMRMFREAGLPISVFAFDSQRDASTDRNALLASSIREYRDQHPREAIVVLMGAAHARQEPFTVGERTITPSGQLLRNLSPVSIMLSYDKGTIWACMPECTIHSISSMWGTGKAVGFVESSPIPGYSHSFVLPSITASPPAAANDG